jgi:hypothetical protein
MMPMRRWRSGRIGASWRCDSSLAGAEEAGRQRRQVVDVRPAPPPKVTEYQRVSKVCQTKVTFRPASAGSTW